MLFLLAKFYQLTDSSFFLKYFHLDSENVPFLNQNTFFSEKSYSFVVFIAFLCVLPSTFLVQKLKKKSLIIGVFLV